MVLRRSRGPDPRVERGIDEASRGSLFDESQSTHGSSGGDLPSKDDSLVDDVDVVALKRERSTSATVEEEMNMKGVNERVRGSLRRKMGAERSDRMDKEGAQRRRRTRVDNWSRESVGGVDHDRSSRVRMLKCDLDGDVGGPRESVENDLFARKEEKSVYATFRGRASRSR